MNQSARLTKVDVLKSVAVGVWASFVSPRWLDTERFQVLLRFNDPQGDSGNLNGVRSAIRTSSRTLWVLSRLPNSAWRNTCLFKSIAECLILRQMGVQAKICVGVRKAVEDRVNAHAWVETQGPHHDNAGFLIQENDYKYIELTAAVRSDKNSPSQHK